MRHMLNICDLYATSHGSIFNANKTQLICFRRCHALRNISTIVIYHCLFSMRSLISDTPSHTTWITNKLLRKLWNLPCDSHSGIVHCIAQVPAISNLFYMIASALYSPLYSPHHLLFCAQCLFVLRSLPIHLQVIIIHTATHITDTIFLMSYMLLL